jgi:glutamyl-Q tRNA(Asp) synthetase
MTQQSEAIGRFAPSPTGPLHFGSLVAAVGSWLDARAAGARWAVRMDDVDRNRTAAGAAEDILRTLEAFGLYWDDPVVYQSTRDEVYAEALERLRQQDSAFPCACTRREVQAGGQAGPLGFIYPGTCRDGLPPDREARSWRLRTDTGTVHFDDRARGRQVVHLADEVGDFIIRRGDGLFAYHLAMVVDDAELGVTDVVRGGDLLPCTAPQIALQQALGLATPRYMHLPVAVNAQGRKLSKQTKAPPVDASEPAPALYQALSFLGQHPPEWVARAAPAESLTWAVQHWRPQGLPAEATLPAPAGTGERADA